MKMQRTDLRDGWTLAHLDGLTPAGMPVAQVPAEVPGTVHTALHAAGCIEDPYLDDQEAAQRWIGRSRWRYRTAFDLDDLGPGLDLVFEGIDTVAAVRLNGKELGRSENMHRSYRYDIRDAARHGPNLLEVDLESPVREADRRSLELGYRPHVNPHPFNALRKMASSFGWDWGIDTASVGIWRPVRVGRWTARLNDVRPVTRVDGPRGHVALHVEVDRTDRDRRLAVAVTVGDRTTRAELGTDTDRTVVEAEIPDVQLWWPRGHGDPTLYDVHVALLDLSDPAGETVLDDRNHRIGFRTVRLDTTPDDHGTPFTLRVNGRRIEVRGANWIPDDAFPHRVTRDRYATRIGQAEFGGLNLLRVWGGGIYESDDFYDLCDERGILVMQDFLFACAAYAEDEPLRSEVEAEAREAVTRLAWHPSLVIFNGNNENLWGLHEWGYLSRLDGATWGAWYYYDLLPRIVADLAPQIGYTPGSPFTPAGSGLGDDPDHNDPHQGTMHIWDVWNEKDYTAYRDYTPRFVAEFGWQAPPTWATLTRAISDDPLTPESPGMIVHQKAVGGNDKLTDGLLPHLRLPNDMSDWHWAMQLNQANAVRTGIGWFRSRAPVCSGNIVWQLNDSWPVTSWSAVDGDGRPKPLLYALRHVNRERLLTDQPAPDGLEASILNDTDRRWTGELLLERRDYDGVVLAGTAVPVAVEPRGAQRVPIPREIGTALAPERELVVASLHGTRDLWFFAEYRDSEPATFDAQAIRVPEGYELTVRARTLIRDLTLLIDKLDPAGFVDDALNTLLPGEHVKLRIESDAALDLETLVAPDVLRSANQLASPGPERG
ncbi:glycoside hydrolase family 2 protein [Glycomyces harbinensis]|uniref:beta-mannosidase n=1 Tax=Glycomyces harbinensis TaxID=58114 RepID=A0A1G7C7W7_9ACTN|nr:beta-mannosidase [Glycomyces harbinensis]SDE35303.1 beta-mannosidase [Glycomyces harbinensis]